MWHVDSNVAMVNLDSWHMDMWFCKTRSTTRLNMTEMTPSPESGAARGPVNATSIPLTDRLFLVRIMLL